MASVGTHIKRLRAAKRMTQEELAEQLHVTRQAVSAWETGKALPDEEMLERIAAALDADVTEVIYGAKSAPDLAALKREWTQRGIGWGLWLAILYYVLFCCGVWGSWTRGLSYQFSNKDYRVMEEVLPGSWSIDVNPREVYNGAKPVIYKDDTGCRITVSNINWDEESGTWNIWFRAEGVRHFYNPWRGVLVTGCGGENHESGYYRTDKFANLTVTIDGESRTADLIGGSLYDRNDLNFGYVLFPGVTGHPAELPEQMTLTLTGLLRLSARFDRR